MLARRRIFLLCLALAISPSVALAQAPGPEIGLDRDTAAAAAPADADSRVVGRRSLANGQYGREMLEAEAFSGPLSDSRWAEPTAYMAAQLEAEQVTPDDAPADSGEALDPAMAPVDYEQEFYQDHHGPSFLDAPAPAVSSGEWVKSGCWYTEQSFLYMERSTNVKNSIILATELQATVFPHDNPFLQIPLGLGFEPGLRSTLGRYIGRDCRNRDHSVEFTFLGLTHWGAAGGLTSITGNGIFTNIDPTVTIAAFNRSSSQTFDTTSDFNSYELNYRIQRRLARDRMLYTRNSTWVRQATPDILPSIYAGIRVVSINEKLAWFAESDTPASTGSYLVTTHNNMVGPQMGADFFFERADWRLGIRTKGGVMVNWDSQSSHVRILQPDGTPIEPNRDEYVKAHDAAFIGEVGFVGAYHLGPSFALRCSYDMMWVTNLALAQNQLTFNPALPPEISDGHALFYQGLTLGIELVR